MAKGTQRPRHQQNQLPTPGTFTRFETPLDDDENREPTPTQPAVRDSGHNLIALTKLYTEEKKYSGDSDSFDYKYSIFIDLCEKAELPLPLYAKAFSVMLRGTSTTTQLANQTRR